MGMNERIVWVDIAKGVGIILVVFGHMIDGYSFLGKYIWSFHMPLFFYLSGLFMPDSLSLHSVQKRTRQLLLPCIVFTIISYAVVYFVLRKPIDIANLSLPVPLWFLTTLFMADMECRLLIKYIPMLYLIVINLLASFVFQFLNWHFPYSLSSVFIASFFYLAGSMMYRRSDLISGGGKSAKVLSLSIVSLPIIIYIFNVNTDLSINQITPIGVVAAFVGITQTIMISILLSKSDLLSRGLSFLGCNSLVIMVTHLIFLQLYCYYVDIPSLIVYKGLQAIFVFGLSIGSIFIFQGRLAVLIGKDTTNNKM